MKNIILKNGLLGGLIVSLVMIGMTYFMKTNPDKEPSAVIGFLSMFAAFYYVVVGIKQQRNVNNGSITFGKAFSTGLLISLVISTIYVLLWLVIYYNFFPNFIEQYSDMVLKNTKPEIVAEKTAEMNQMKEWYKNPVMVILLTYMEIFPIGILYTLVSSIVLKRR